MLSVLHIRVSLSTFYKGGMVLPPINYTKGEGGIAHNIHITYTDKAFYFNLHNMITKISLLVTLYLYTGLKCVHKYIITTLNRAQTADTLSTWERDCIMDMGGREWAGCNM